MSDAMWKALLQAQKRDAESKEKSKNHLVELMAKYSTPAPDPFGGLFGGYTPVVPEPVNAFFESMGGHTPPAPVPFSSLFGEYPPASLPGLSQNAFADRANPPEKSLIGRIASLKPPPAIGPRLKLSALLPPPTPAPSRPGFAWCRSKAQALLSRVAKVTDARVLPDIDDLAILQGRRTRAAFVYSDLHGFTKLVATQPENTSFVFLDTFVYMADLFTRHYNGEVMEVAGDRVLSVFHRPLGDLSNDPVEDAVTFALWLQTVFSGAFTELSLDSGLSCALFSASKYRNGKLASLCL